MWPFCRPAIAVLLAIGLAWLGAAHASAPPAAPPLSPPPAAPPASVPPVHDIAVFGDSLADGVWAGLYQELKAAPQDKLYRDSKVGTGLTRPEYENFVQGFVASLTLDHVTDAVVMFGANDDEGLRDANHKGHAFGTPGWQGAYAARMQEIMAACQKQGIRVFWLGLPVLRDPERNRDALVVNMLLRQTVTQSGEVFLPLEDDFKDASGGFAPYLPDAKGNLRQLRAPDGTHFTFRGYDLIARKVLAAILAPPLAMPTPPAASKVVPVPPPLLAGAAAPPAAEVTPPKVPPLTVPPPAVPANAPPPAVLTKPQAAPP